MFRKAKKQNTTSVYMVIDKARYGIVNDEVKPIPDNMHSCLVVVSEKDVEVS